MKKNEKGMTTIVLALIIVILVIIGSIAIRYGTNIIEEATLQDLKTNMLLIQASLKGNLEQYNFGIQTVTTAEEIEQLRVEYLVGEQLTEEDMANMLSGKDVPNLDYSKYDYYCLDTDTITSLGINDVQSDEDNGYYIVGYSVDKDFTDNSYETIIQVINTKGYDGNYSLEQIESIE